MEEKRSSPIVPDQRTGKAIDAESSVLMQNETSAKAFFEIVKNRLQYVNDWHKLTGDLSARFQLVNKEGVHVYRRALEGDYLKIDIPGPGNKTGRGYDWVQIEAIEDTSFADVERFGFRVRPAENPQSHRHDIAHFYSHESTSTFIVTRDGNRITAAISDRNTKPNKDAAFATDKLRDAVVGAVAAITFSKIQWKGLTDGLVRM